MQAILTLSAGYGLPVSISGGITHRLNVSKEIADHERLGEALRRRSRGGFSINQGFEMGDIRLLEVMMKEAVAEDLQLCSRLCSRAA